MKIDHFQLVGKSKFIVHYALFLYQRAKQDNIKVPAGYLAYVTLLSLVPVLAVIFDMLSAFPMFSELEKSLESFIYSNFVPSSGEMIQSHISGFIENTKQMTVMGIGSLVVIALLLISAIEQSINRIWRSTTKRRGLYSFLIYWAILSIGPIMLGSSIALTTYSIRIIRAHGFLSFGEQVISFLPFTFTWAAITGIYTIVPRQKVSVRYALVGALVATLLFFVGTEVFSLYITNFPTQQLIYGALAILPILFIWVYFSWYIILTGAIVTATLEEYIDLHYLKKYQAKKDVEMLHDSDDPEGY